MTEGAALESTGRFDERLPVEVSGSRSFGWWGMVWLIATESALFASLIFGYFFLRFRTPGEWPPAGIDKPELMLPLIMTAILWSSSLPVHLADRAAEQGDQGGLRRWLAAGFALGAVFLGMQIFIEYPEKLRHFTPATNAYGSLFYTLTGFHGLHVLIGLLMSLWAQMRAWQGAFRPDRHITVQVFAMYWHFVDVVWAFVLFTIYVSPHL